MQPAEFRAYYEPALEREEAKHGLILNALARMVGETPAQVSYWTLGGPGECAIMMARHSIVLGALPPELRGRGYAGSATAATVERVYAEGRSIACLYADLRNPASNRCYTKIGFAPVCRSLHFHRNV